MSMVYVLHLPALLLDTDTVQAVVPATWLIFSALRGKTLRLT